MSGSALAPWAVVSDPARATLQVASTLNCTEEQLQAQKPSRNRGRGGSGGGGGNIGDQSLLGCLRSVPLYQLMRAARPAALHQAAKAKQDSGQHSSDPNLAISDLLLTAPSAQPIRSTWGPSFDGVVVHSFRRRMRDYLDRMAR